jgi:hypothetical protein
MMTDTTEQQREADDAVQDQHDGREDRVAHQPLGVRATRHHQ